VINYAYMPNSGETTCHTKHCHSLKTVR